MTTKNTGGPAFPLADPNMINPMSVAEYESAASGMTLRDWFAGQFLCGRAAVTGSVDARYDAVMAYEVADAMLSERDK